MIKYTIVKVCPICKSQDSVVAVCDNSNDRSTFEFENMPIHMDICTKCGHIILFHAKPSEIKLEKR